jgi:hypothetical protein
MKWRTEQQKKKSMKMSQLLGKSTNFFAKLRKAKVWGQA